MGHVGEDDTDPAVEDPVLGVVLSWPKGYMTQWCPSNPYEY